MAELEHAARHGAAARSTPRGGRQQRQHRLDTSQKIVSSLAKLPVHAPSKAPAGWPPTLTIPPYLCYIYICMLCTYAPHLAPLALLITVTFCDFNLPRSTEAIWGQFKMPLKVSSQSSFPRNSPSNWNCESVFLSGMQHWVC